MADRSVKVIQPTSELSEENHIVRVAAYCRVSTDSEDQESSFLAQVNHYTEKINQDENMTLVDIYADEGITGTSMNKREEFKRLLRDASLGRIDRVLCKSVTRFARNSLECLECVRKLGEYGVSVCFENDNIDTKTMNSEMILYLKSAFAQSESLASSSRISTAYRMKMERGVFSTFHAPYGYRLVNRQLQIEPDEAEIVKRIFDMYLSGEGMNRISATLNREEVPSSEGLWCNAHIRYVLTNEKYVGDSLTQKTYTPQMLPLRNRPNNGQLDKFYIANTHPAIIEKETFDKAQKLLESRKYYGEHECQKYLLSRMIQCAECGWSYRRKLQNDKVYWVCSHKGQSGFECGGQNYSEQEIFDAFVCMYNKLRHFEKELIDNTLSQLNELHNIIMAGNTEIKQIDDEIVRLSEQNSKYEKYRAKQIMDEVSFMEQTARLTSRLSELRSRRMKLLKDDENEQIIENIRLLKKTLEEFPRSILSFEQDIFEAITEKIKAGNDGTLTFVLKGGLSFTEDVR